LQKKGKAYPHLIAGIWTLSQAVRTFFPVDFYWSDLGHSQYNNKFFIQWASIGSTYFITFMIVWISVVIYSWLKGKKPKKESFVLVVVVVLLSVYSVIRIYKFNSMKNIQTIKVALLQANINQFEANSKIKNSYDIIKIYKKMLNKIDKNTDLVVWHEASFPFAFPKGYSDFKKIWNKYFKNTPLFSQQIIGIDLVDYLRHKQYNSAAFIKNGKIAEIYNKIKLAPFGEYMPGASVLKLFGITQLVPSSVGSFSRGKTHTVYDFGKFKASALICFDGTGSENVRSFVKNGANLLVSITNDAWFYYSSAAFQHLSFYTFRSVETGKTIIRSANIGISGYIYPDGSLHSATKIFKRTIVNKKVKLYNLTSFYQKYGNVFLWLLMFYVFSIILREKYGENSKS
jgi:apolipoprotein N-acyltransferase